MSVQRFLSRGVIVLACGVLGAGAAWANGAEVFGTKDTKLDMYYFGHIKDTDGKVLDNAVVTVIAKNISMKFPFRNDAPGHFRSPDIGKAIKGLGKTIDPSQMEITIQKKGYVLTAPVKVPNKAEGGIGPLEFIMAPAPAPSTNSGTPPAGQVTVPDRAAHGPRGAGTRRRAVERTCLRRSRRHHPSARASRLRRLA